MPPHDRPRIPPSLHPRDEPVPDLPPPEPPSAAPAATAPPAAPRPGIVRRIWRALTRTFLWTFLCLVLLALVPPGVVLWLRWNPPPTTSFMQRSEVKPVDYRWVPKEQIPEALRQGAIAAEDQKFFTHWGFDFIAIAEALEHNEKSRKKRGASTITQQTAKNLFLWPSRSWLRKGLEVTFTLLLEFTWPKERILEVYLNIAEFGPGVYGAEAAAQKFFGKPASKMTAVECAHLVAVLPNPRKWRADRPGPYVQSRVDWVLDAIGHAPRYAAAPDVQPEGPPPEEGMELVDPSAVPDVQTPPGVEVPPATEEDPVTEPATDAEEMPADEAAPPAETGEMPAEPAEQPRY